MTDRHGISPSTVETVAGLSAGLISTVLVHPLDIIKTRLQVDTSSRSVLGSSLRVFRAIFRNEGPNRIAALYRGLTPNLVGNSAGWALYFLWYGKAQDVIRSYHGYSATVPLSTADYLSASAASGMLTAVLTNPIWVIKTRMLSTSAAQPGAYPSMLSGLQSIWRLEGPRGFFHGLTPTLAGVSHGALYFAAYEKLKAWRRRRNPTGDLTNLDTIVTSSLSKVFAGTLTYPHQLVRARMQTYDPALVAPVASSPGGIATYNAVAQPSSDRGGGRPGLVATVRNVWRHEGALAFYKGLGPNLLRVVPSTCVTFLVYENVRSGLPRIFPGQDDNAALQ